MTGKNERTRPRPSQRDRYRYIAFRLTTDDDRAVRRDDMIRTIQDATRTHDAAGAEPWLTRFDGTRGILRVLRGNETQGRNVLDSITEIRVQDVGVPVHVSCLLTSGTIASLQRKAFAGDRIDA
jgi:RNase P/RNase MRP subunit POP5